MSLQKRCSPTQSPPSGSAQHLKQRVITCLNKLADRDTQSLATIELESIAKTLTQESFSSFLSCLHNTDSSCKSPVRKQCVNLLTLLSESHGNSLSPHLSKMVATVVRRLRDPDSSVRSACIVATTAMSSHITKPSFSVVSRPLIELILGEQDANSQVGGAMCLSAAIEAAANPEVEQLKKLLPRLGKVVKSEGSKAKAAVLGVIGSVVKVGGAKNKGVLDWLVPFIRELLCCDDWATRKAAAEVLGKVAFVEKDFASEYKNACLVSLERSRFDKIKIVRETMNCTLELWKGVPDYSDEVSAPSQSKSSSTDDVIGGCFRSITKSFQDVGFKTPPPEKMVPTCSSPSSDSLYGTIAKNEVTLRSSNRRSSTPMLHKSSDDRKPSDWKVEIAVPHSPSKVICADGTTICDSGHPELRKKGNDVNSRPETKRALFSKTHNNRVYKFGGFRSRSRVVPCPDNENSDHVAGEGTEEVYEDPEDYEELSMVREQLLQIENQQSSLLDLLQRFIGSSQSGMNSLETRVQGLEMALDKMSYDLALSSGVIPNKKYAETTCCKLPGTEFLSCKFWRTEGRFSTTRLSSSGNMECFRVIHNTADTETYNRDNQKLQHLHGGGYFLNSLSDWRGLRETSGFHSNRTMKNIIHECERSQGCRVDGLDGASPFSVSKTQVNINRRLST